MKLAEKNIIKRKLSIILAIVSFAVIFPAVSNAFELFSISSIGTSVIGSIAYVINYMIGYLAGVLFSLAGVLIDFSLRLNSNIMSSTNKFLYTGWNIILGFADLSFILVIIIIAFATILHLESYGMKKTLWKLIVVALLVNFSLVIAGVFIDSAGVFTNFFISKATGLGPTEMSNALAGAFNIQSFLNLTGSKIDGNPLESWGAATLQAIASIAFTSIFTITAAIVLLGIFIMLMVRYIALSLLLVFSPLAMVAWIFPGTAKLWNMWWDKFINWVLFAPAVTFLLYLSIVSLQNMSGSTSMTEMKGTAAYQSLVANNFLFAVSNIGQMVMAVGMLMASLFAASFFSKEGSKAAIGAAKGGTKAFAGYAGRRTAQRGRQANEMLGRAGTRMIESRNPLIRTVGRGIIRTQTGVKTVASKISEQIKKRETGLTGSVLSGYKAGSGLFKKKKEEKKPKFTIAGVRPTGEPILQEVEEEEEKKEEKKA